MNILTKNLFMELEELNKKLADLRDKHKKEEIGKTIN
jgi:hypothetical protein